MPTTRSPELTYVYGAVEGASVSLPQEGVPGGSAPRAVPLHEDISLIVSAVPASVYAADALEPRLADLDWVSSAGAAHHAVVDAIADRGVVVLPVRLFTIFSSESKAVATMSGMREGIRQAFDRVRGRQEWVLRIGKPDPTRLQPTTPDSSTRASGTSFLKAKADARRESATRAERVQSDAIACRDALARLADATNTRPVDPAANLLLDTAFLVKPVHVHALRESLTQTAARLLQDGCPVSLTGPWPPYSFSSIDTATNG